MNYRHALLSCLIASSTLLSACISLPSKAVTNPAKLLERERASIVTGNELSASTLSILLSSGLSQQACLSDIDNCISAVQGNFISDANSRQLLAASAELYYASAALKLNDDDCRLRFDRPPIDANYANAPLSAGDMALRKKEQNACLDAYQHSLMQALRTSYAYIFYHALTAQGQPSPIATESDVRTLDIYHLAMNDLISALNQTQYSPLTATLKPSDAQQYEPRFGQLNIAHADIPIHDKPVHLSLSIDERLATALGTDALKHHQTQIFSEFISSYDTRLSKLDVNAGRSGLGVSFIGALHERRTIDGINLAQSADLGARIHNMGRVQLTALLRPQGDTLADVLNADSFNIYFFSPQYHQAVTLFGTDYPLTANNSATYALWLSENRLRQSSLMNMLSRREDVGLPELFMLEPYDPNQKVIIMLHGLASSPATWVNLTNTLLADSQLNDGYQVWQIAYPTNLPILENRYQIDALIRAAFKQVDPTGTDAASRDAVIIGHSMGGVLARLLISDDNLTTRLDTLGQRDQRKLTQRLSAADRDAINQRLMMQHLPQVSTAVFISAPFRGTDYADRWFTRTARRIIQLPAGLTKVVGQTIAQLGDGEDRNTLSALYLQNGASQLSDSSAFMALTRDVQIVPQVRYHSIIGDHKGDHKSGDVVSRAISDGIVPYSSSHLAGATSERIITGRHNIHENPQTILELRKILHNRLKPSL